MNAAETRRLEEITARYEERITEQATSIARLLRHLEYHHQELGHHSAEDCEVLSGKVRLQ